MNDSKQKIAQELRDTVQTLRRTPMPIADIVPLLQRAADALSDETTAERQIDLAFQVLEANGVPRERARTVHNGIGVLMTRMQRESGLQEALIKAMTDCIGPDEHQTFEQRAEELIVTEVQHEWWDRLFAAWVKHQAGLPSDVPLWPNSDWPQDVAMVAHALATGAVKTL